MSILVFAFGLALSVGGAFAIYFGYGIVSVERGWASVIAGATALSGGVVTMALGLILNSLTKLRNTIEAGPSAIPLPDEVRLYPDEEYAGAPYGESFNDSFQTEQFQAPADADSENAHEAETWRRPAPAAETMEDVRRAVAEKVRARTGIVDTPAESIAPQLDEDAPERPSAPPLAHGDFGAAEDDRGLVERSAPESFGHPVDHDIPAATRSTPPAPVPTQAEHEFGDRAGPAPADAEARVVVRRYESAGIVYAMYADGSIEAQSEHGVMHFETIAELKAFMASQPRGPS